MQCAATVLAMAHVLASGPGTSLTPVDSAAESIVGYVLSYGLVGIVLVALAWLMFKGWRLVSPAFEARIRAEARADLEAERNRLLAEKVKAEEERDEALRVARDQMVPLLSSFVTTTGTLVPLLQEIVLSREPPPRRRRGGPDP